MSVFATGAPATRPRRSSRLIFGWRAKGKGLDSPSGLDAYTGQAGGFGFFVNPGAVPATIEGRNGAVLSAGFGLPRWEQVAARGNVTRLAIEGEVTGQHVEQASYSWPLGVMPLSIYVRLWPMYASGSDVGIPRYALTLGNDTIAGGRLSIYRSGTAWGARRERGGAGLTSSFTESESTAYPIDLLVTLATGGVLTLKSRDANGLLQNASAASDANMLIATEAWAGGILTLAGVTGLVLPGGRWRYEAIKIARNVRTLAEMDLLS